MGRPRKPTMSLGSLEECTRAMGELLVAQLEMERLTTRRDLGVARLQARYEGPIDAAKATVTGIHASLEAYYYAHLAEIERDGVQHVDLANGRIGRRMHPPKLAPLNKSWTWGRIAELLQVKFGMTYLRTRDPEVDRDRVKAELAVEELKQLGLKLDQDEKFYAEPARLERPEEVRP